MVDNTLLNAPVKASLLVPCRVAYPLRESPSEASLRAFYEVLIFNMGQVEKCYNKDESLVNEIILREHNVNRSE